MISPLIPGEERVPFDLANSSFTFELDPEDGNEELISTISFSTSRIDRFGEPSRWDVPVDVCGTEADILGILSRHRNKQRNCEQR